MRTGRTTIPSAVWLLVIASMVVLAVACASEADGDRSAIDDSRAEDAGAAADDETTTTEAPTTTSASITTTTTLPVVESGTYVVPDQFAPGTYRVEGTGRDWTPTRRSSTTTSLTAGSRS